MITIRDVGDALIYLGAIAAALGAITVVVKWAVVQPLKTMIRTEVRQVREQTTEIKQKADKVQETADRVHAEVSPNHGHSLKDAVTRTEHAVNALTRRFEDHLLTHSGGGP